MVGGDWWREMLFACCLGHSSWSPSGVNQHGYTRPGCPPYAWDHPHPPQVLLVFGREDNVSEAWWSACKRQGYDVVLKRNTEDAIKAFLDHTHDLI
ncbi:high affinity cAMP-specific and IBMX-insensitive 3',5'-cyclic phosphodiesterase 8B-like, partial [Homarus americanus]|uniref:high affinity cAMP-specific and IBMX-insensitive 3',5'-cyclic phosphodiesterase 8B-like n=1 Tax=Homarus americanus TaxID=6706 RepID=UPI001C4974DD